MSLWPSLKMRSARLFSSVTSASVRSGRPSSCLGRSKGVAFLFTQFPCRSGWPSDVKGGAQGLTLWTVCAGMIDVTANVRAANDTPDRMRITDPPPGVLSGAAVGTPIGISTINPSFPRVYTEVAMQGRNVREAHLHCELFQPDHQSGGYHDDECKTR